LVQFDFNLALDAPGWADPVIESDGARLQMTASYLTDALGDLMGALLQLVNGSSSAQCCWAKDPGNWDWVFVRPNETEVEVSIGFRDERSSGSWLPDGTDEPRFHTRVTLVELVRAVVDGARRCFDSFGAEGFARQWIEHPFPALQVDALRRWLDTGGVAARFVTE
jgi:hypothetical protein